MADSHAQTEVYEAVVIGGGIAGASVAYSLAKRKIKTLLLEKRQNLAEGASGNPVGLIYPFLTKHKTSESEFSLFAFRFLNEEWNRIRESFRSIRTDRKVDHFSKEGIHFLTQTETDKDRYHTALSTHNVPETEAEIKKQTSFSQDKESVFFKNGKTVSPPLFTETICRLAEDHLTIHTSEEFIRWEDGSPIEMETEQKKYRSQFLFLCNSNEISEDHRTKWMTLRKVRGQIVRLPKDDLLIPLDHSVLFGNYITEDLGYGSVLGASFDEFKWEEEPRVSESVDMIRSAKSVFPESNAYWDRLLSSPEALQTRVSFRSQTQDRRPVLGNLPDAEIFQKENPYKKGESHIRKSPKIKYHNNVYVLGGLGSRGLTHSLLSAEIIVREALSEPSLLPQNLRDDFRPERFLLRNWKRGIPIGS